MTSKREPIRAFEGQPARVPRDIYDSLADEGERVAKELRLRVGGVTRLAGALRFDNMIGTIATPRGAIEIVPKTLPGQNWLRSVVDLLDDRPVTIADDVPSSDHTTRATFRNLIAAIYARRLTRALAAEGPITTIEAERHRSGMLGGRLMVEEWVRTVANSPHSFPIERQTLSTRNSFARTLAYVGQLLAPHVADPALRRRLVDAIDQMANGQDLLSPPPDAIDLPLPDQWGGYLPAWTIAQMILKDRSQAGERPRAHGISIAIEPWVLLERLLERSVAQLAKTLNSAITSYSSKAQMRRMFLSGRLRDAGERFLYPDCVLIRDDIPLVSFEAKYRNYDRTGAPMRSESYQAITAGRALDTEMAVLVYPNGNEPKVLDVLQRGHRPERLATVGLDLFDYRHGREIGIAEKFGKLLENVTGTDTIAEEGAVA